MTGLAPQIHASRDIDTSLLNVQRQALEFNRDGNASNEAVKQAAQEFEAVFLGQMLRHMYEGIEVDEVFGGGYAEEVFRDLMLDEYGKTLAKAGGVGVADSVQRKLLQTQMQ